MKSESILRSDVLDIIFENRNKAYGAYVLRKQYNKRLTEAVFVMMGFVLVFAVLQAFKRTTTDHPFLPVMEGPPEMSIAPVPKPQEIAHLTSTSSTHNSAERPPQIVKADSVIQTKEEPLSIVKGLDLPFGPPSEGPGAGKGSPGGTGDSVTTKVIEKVKPFVDKTQIVDHWDISPEYPGGINALLKFLKSNLHSPDELEAETQVKVRFVVNYDGTLMRFDVVQSGGEVFDNEVIRVLKRMPRWIPGKSNGDNVAVWYTVPVRFIPTE